MKFALVAVLVTLAGCGSCPPGFDAIEHSTSVIVDDNEAYISADTKLTDGEKVATRLRNREAVTLAKKLSAECAK